ncbi:hypothetical protein SH584_04055 [Sphingomonas sp. LY29]|uniref:hypothetical protein n=1 Tax=Sphingomonas sp. LY29 TaxID=3095341 RepID=UPI002D786293|nr:hypothetical protein [Sphingomonas sp. LY29]WRP26615.1 hypothetical protein SH584_04055 [Sphingomonas sp. LY29]
MDAPAPKVLLAEAEDGMGYAVTVLPAQDVGHDRQFTNYLQARTYARLLRFGHGWQLVDRCDERTRKAANG